MSEPAETSLQKCPFRKADELNSDLDTSRDCLPGYPRIKLSDDKNLLEFICSQLWSEDLELISDKLWWMSKQDSGNISSLHRQIVKGRKIMITEDPHLHLVWIDDRIFIKPLPRYLASCVFWQEFMSNLPKEIAASKLKEAALGYLRTYLHLIQYKSDLRITQDPVLCLVPKEVTWSQFCGFPAAFNDIADDQVSGRDSAHSIELLLAVSPGQNPLSAHKVSISCVLCSNSRTRHLCISVSFNLAQLYAGRTGCHHFGRDG